MSPLIKDLTSAVIDNLSTPADIFDIFTFAKDAGIGNQDEHGRARFEKTMNWVMDPIVSNFAKSLGFSMIWPENHRFAVALTHDIDLIEPSRQRCVINSLKSITHGDFESSRSYMSYILKKRAKSPYLDFRKFLKTEENYGARSTFFMMANGPDQTGAGYDPLKVQTEIGSLIDCGCEIGLHGSYYAMDSIERMLAEKDVIEKISGKRVLGYRNHYLRFRYPETWNSVGEAGMCYDSTLGFFDHIGFRNGVAHPFIAYDINERQRKDIWVLPLSLMDCTLFHYMNLNPKEAFDNSIAIIDAASRVGGLVVLLWHNTTFEDPGLKEYAKVYEKLLAYCSTQNAWITTCGNIASWCAR